MNSDISTVCNDGYDTRILRALRKIIRAIDIHSRKLNKEFNITTPQLICLHSLRDSGPMTLSQLASEVSLGTSTTTGIVDRLVSKQFVTRTRSEQDRRKISLVITETGRKLIESAPTLLQQQFMEALSQLPESEQAAITLSLENVVSLMDIAHLDTSLNLVPGANASISDANSKESPL